MENDKLLFNSRLTLCFSMATFFMVGVVLNTQSTDRIKAEEITIYPPRIISDGKFFISDNDPFSHYKQIEPITINKDKYLCIKENY